ncbi:hypothetical protein BJX68DRAFT_273580 [Aspergillus pseudodeflectus]|uniref:Myb-like domain-containing protein n=1 Tax=Aspergillus pseudodeflectus TaxID=176178 RepID=A0ABR4J835_9EURO
MDDSASLSLFSQMSPESIEGLPRTPRTWKPWTDEERARLKLQRNLNSHLTWTEFAKLNLFPGRSKNSISLEFCKMEKAERQKKLESKKRRAENDGANPNSPVHRSKRRPITYETVVIDSDDDESSPEDGNILYSGEMEPLQTPNRISSPDTGRSPDKRQEIRTLLLKLPYKRTQPVAGLPEKPPYPIPPPPVAMHTPTPPTSLTTIPINPTQLAAGLPPKPPCPVPPLHGVTGSDNASRLTEDALAHIENRNVPDADNAHSAPMSVSDATELWDTLPRNNSSDTTQIHQAGLTPVATEKLLLHEPHRAAEATPSSAASPITGKLPPLSRDKLVLPSQQTRNQMVSPTSAVNSASVGGRSASLPVTCSDVSKLKAGGPDQTGTSIPPSADYKILWPLPNKSAQESKITEVCQELSHLLRSGVIDGKRRDAVEKAAAIQQRNLQQQMDDLKEKVARQAEQIGRLLELNKEKDQRIAALGDFEEQLVVAFLNTYKRRSTEKGNSAE